MNDNDREKLKGVLDPSITVVRKPDWREDERICTYAGSRCEEPPVYWWLSAISGEKVRGCTEHTEFAKTLLINNDTVYHEVTP
jgi:hypothetical protein